MPYVTEQHGHGNNSQYWSVWGNACKGVAEGRLGCPRKADGGASCSSRRMFVVWRLCLVSEKNVR